MTSWLQPTLPQPSGTMLQDAERQAGRIFNQSQFKTMAARHPPEEIIRLQVVVDYGQQAADEAKAWRLVEARRWLGAIEGIQLCAHPEFEEARSLSLSPVWALVRWREGDLGAAVRDLERALTAGYILATQFEHDYLTTKLIHLAANVARVLQSAAANERALAAVDQLHAVIAGDASRWPYDGAATLKVPLEGAEREIIERQLRRTEGLANAALSEHAAERAT